MLQAKVNQIPTVIVAQRVWESKDFLGPTNYRPVALSNTTPFGSMIHPFVIPAQQASTHSRRTP
jgi:hypothetical protein